MVGEATVPLSSLEDLDWCRRFERLLSLRLPDLTGKSVLDVSALDGYFSFAAERFGASRVATVDLHAWRRPGARDRFEHERDRLDSQVEDLDIYECDVSRDTVGQFDVVLFLGALNRVREPLLTLERMAGVTKELLVVETLVDMTLRHSVAPADGWQLSPTETNWRGLRPSAVMGMLYGAGFSLVVSYQPKRLGVGKLMGLPASARTAAHLLSSTPWRSRERLVRDCARSLLTQRQLVTHGSR